MKTTTPRALRRHHYFRLQAKRVRDHHFGRKRDDWTPARLGVATDTPCNCSCHMCGNPRRSNRKQDLTLAEQRHDDATKAQFEEYVAGR